MGWQLKFYCLWTIRSGDNVGRVKAVSLSVLLPAISLMFSTSMFSVGIVWLTTHIACALLSHVDLVYQIRKCGLLKVDFKSLNFLSRELLYSLAILFREFLSSLRQRGNNTFNYDLFRRACSYCYLFYKPHYS